MYKLKQWNIKKFAVHTASKLYNGDLNVGILIPEFTLLITKQEY